MCAEWISKTFKRLSCRYFLKRHGEILFIWSQYDLWKFLLPINKSAIPFVFSRCSPPSLIIVLPGLSSFALDRILAWCLASSYYWIRFFHPGLASLFSNSVSSFRYSLWVSGLGLRAISSRCCGLWWALWGPCCSPPWDTSIFPVMPCTFSFLT